MSTWSVSTADESSRRASGKHLTLRVADIIIVIRSKRTVGPPPILYMLAPTPTIPRLLLLSHRAFNKAVDARATSMEAAAAAEEKSAVSDIKAEYGELLERFDSEPICRVLPRTRRHKL